MLIEIYKMPSFEQEEIESRPTTSKITEIIIKINTLKFFFSAQLTLQLSSAKLIVLRVSFNSDALISGALLTLERLTSEGQPIPRDGTPLTCKLTNPESTYPTPPSLGSFTPGHYSPALITQGQAPGNQGQPLYPRAH